MPHAVPDLSLVIPCYRDGPHLRAHVERIRRALQGTRLGYELILVNDASPDNCREIIGELIADFPEETIRFIDHEQNTGRGKAVADGIRAATGHFVGFLDIDLEVPAHYIAPLVERLQDGADVACAHRIYKTHPGLLHRAVLSRGYATLLRHLLRVDLVDTEAGFKFFRRIAILPVLADCQDKGWFWDTEIMVRAQLAGLRINFVPVLFLRNQNKASTVRIFRDSLDYWKRLLPFRAEVARLRHAAGHQSSSPPQP